MQGYSPIDAQKKALESVKAEKFVSKEAPLVEINNMSDDLKKKLNNLPKASDVNNMSGQTTGEEPVEEPEPKSDKLWIIAGVLILILTAK